MRFPITSKFGAVESVRSGAHTGIDLGMPTGTELRSIVEGEIIQIFSGNGSIGKGVRIMTKEGKEFLYGHMENVSVKVGDIIHFGQQLGISGNTGNSTGPHLHFAVLENGKYINPESYIDLLKGITGKIQVNAVAVSKSKNPFVEMYEFFSTWRKEGFWNATTGMNFKEWCLAQLNTFGKFIYEIADYSLVIVLILLLFAMFGSKRAATGIYWTFATYIIIKAVGGSIL